MSHTVIPQQAGNKPKDPGCFHQGHARPLLPVGKSEIRGCVKAEAEFEGDEDEYVDEIAMQDTILELRAWACMGRESEGSWVLTMLGRR